MFDRCNPLSHSESKHVGIVFVGSAGLEIQKSHVLELRCLFLSKLVFVAVSSSPAIPVAYIPPYPSIDHWPFLRQLPR